MTFEPATVLRTSRSVAVALCGLLSTSPGWTQTPPSATGVSPSDGGAASVTPEQAVEETFWAADERFSAGAYAEAAALFTRALELSQGAGVTGTWREFSPKIAFNIAQSYRRDKHCEAAQMAYAHYAGLTDPLPEEHSNWYRELLAECPSLEPLPQDLKRSPVALEPEVEKLTPAPLANPQTGGSEAGTAWTMDLNMPPSSARDPGGASSGWVWGWGAAGGGVVALAAGAGFWFSGNHQHDLAQKQRLWADAEPYESSARTRWTVAGVLAGAGVVLGGASVYFFTRGSDETPKSPAAKASLHLRTSGTALQILGQF